MQQFSDIHRPQTLADIAGNPKPMKVLAALLARPFASAWLLEGVSGIGKTTAALCVANALASDMDIIQMNGHNVNAEAVRKLADSVRYAPFKADGWRVVIVDEADRMSHAAQILWLSLLEELGRCIVIFTSNEAGDFESRFVSRLKRLHFTNQGMAKAGANRLQTIAKAQGFPLDEKAATKMMRDAGNNLRAAVQSLEIEAMLAEGEAA